MSRWMTIASALLVVAGVLVGLFVALAGEPRVPAGLERGGPSIVTPSDMVFE